MQPPAPADDDQLVWYFAYGSNLDPETFLGRRQMRPHESRPALLREHRLVFDLAVGRGERGVANVLAAAGEKLWGVAYRIRTEEAVRLDVTEGVPDAYQRLAIEIEIADGTTVSGFTYVSSRRREGRRPSERYMNLLLRGARLNGLPGEWIEFLRGFEHAADERLAQLELFSRARGEPSSSTDGGSPSTSLVPPRAEPL